MSAFGFGAGLLGMPPLVAQYMPRAYSASITPSSVATISAVEQTFTVTGVNVGDVIKVTPPSITSGVAPVCARVTAADTVGITFVNPTAGSLTPAAGNYLFIANKCL